ncbi:MAG: hypothetical protein ABI240_18225 [Sphingomonas sp.]
MHKSLRFGAAIAALMSTPLSAQSVTAPEPAAASDAGLLSLNVGVPIDLVVSKEVNSSTDREGDPIALTVMKDIQIGTTTVIPRGTPAVGEITWRTGKGAFGKSGKMEFVLSYIDLNGRRIPISGEYRQEGEGNTIATGVGIIAVGVFAGFITGKRARVPTGRELLGQIAEPVQFNADGQLAASYDDKAAMAAAKANTPLGKCQLQAAAMPQNKQKKAQKDCFSKRME